MDDAEREARRRRREAWAADNLARQTAVMDDLVARAGDTLRWLAVNRQASSYLRHLATWQRSKGFTGINDMLDAHEQRLRDWVAQAEAAVAGVNEDERRDAQSRLGLRIAIIGKGGAGKTVIASTVARLLARQGRRVLAADMDVNPGLAYSIGLGGEDVSVPVEALEENEGSAYGWQLRSGLLPQEFVERYTVAGPDGVAVTGLGKIGEADKSSAKRTVVALIQILLGFGEPEWDVIGDLEAGPTTPFERYHAFADDVVVVVGPAWRSAMTARRLLPMVGEGRTTTIVANRFRDEPDHPGLAPHVRIPFDADVAEAERQGLSPLDACPDSPTIKAIEQVVELFVSQEVARSAGRKELV
jgi:CO dehydrogenase maturation factor